MANINHVIVEGNLTKAAELSRWSDGTPYIRFTIANNEYYKNVDKAHYEKQIPISENASRDSDFLTESATEKVEKEAVIDTKTVSEASNKFTESYLDYYDVKDGLANYDRVTDLLLQFYDGKLY